MTEKDLLKCLKQAFDDYAESANYDVYKEGMEDGFNKAWAIAKKVILNADIDAEVKDRLFHRLTNELNDYKVENF